MNPRLKIFIYSDFPSKALDIEFVADSLKGLGFDVEDRGNLLDFLEPSEDRLSEFAQKLSGAQVEDISSELLELSVPSDVRVNSEAERLQGGEDAKGVLYDAYWLQRILHKELFEKVPQESEQGYLHIVFTGRLFGTFEDRRYHARVLLAGEPSFISTSGLVEAPARPREYYFIKGGLIQSGKDTGVLDQMYRGRFVEYDDPKTSSIMCSYALQAVSYHLTGKAFCDNGECCLYNSHWQEEVLRVQHEGKPCSRCMEKIGI